MSGFNEKTDLDLVIQIKENNCQDSLLELIARHENLYYRMWRRYLPDRLASGADIQDDKYFVIYKAACSFKIGKKMKVSSWIALYTRYYCLNQIKKNGPGLLPIQDFNFDLPYYQPNSNMKEYVLYLLKNLKDERIPEIFKLRYFNNKKKFTWREIGLELGISQPTAISLHSKSIKFLKSKITSRAVCDYV